MRKVLERIYKITSNTTLIICHAATELKYLKYANLLLQFISIFFLKLIFQISALNPILNNVELEVKSTIQNPQICILINILIFLLFSFSIALIVILQNNPALKQQNQKVFFNRHNLTSIFVKIYFLLEYLYLPTLVININIFNNLTTQQQIAYLNIDKGIAILAALNTLLIFIGTKIYSENMLLQHWTVLIVIFSINPTLIAYPMKVASIFIMAMVLPNKDRFTRILIASLLFLFVIDFFSYALSITFSMLYFLVFQGAILMIQITRPLKLFYTDLQKQNQILIKMISKLLKDKRFTKKEETILLSIVFYNKDRVNNVNSQLTKNSFEMRPTVHSVNILNPQWLIMYFKHKITIDIKQHPKNIMLRLQLFYYQLKHEPLTIDKLYKIIKFRREQEKKINIKERILLMEIGRIIKQKYFNKEDQIKQQQILNNSKNVELFYKMLYEITQLIILFWTEFKNKHMTETKTYQMLQLTLKKQKEIAKIMQKMCSFRINHIEVKLFHYIMKLLNFDYESKLIHKKNQMLQNSKLISASYMSLSQNNTISEISNLILVQLNRKKDEVIDQNIYELFIPHELFNYFKSRLDKSIQDNKETNQFIFPFTLSKKHFLPYKVTIQLKFHFQNGLNYIIHFLKNQEVEQSPSFLYSIEDDSIVSSCPLFDEYLRLKSRRVQYFSFCTDLFGVDLAYQIIKNGKAVNDKIFCHLKQQKHKQNDLAIVLKIRDIYYSKNEKYALIQIEKNIAEKSQEFKTIIRFMNQIEERQLEQEQQREKRKTISEDVNLCKISNPYQILIDEKMRKLNNCNTSYLKIIFVMMLLIILPFGGAILFLNVEVGTISNEYKTTTNTTLQRNTDIQTIYLAFYQYYQYYQIKNYPQQILQIDNYNLTQINNEYYKKTNKDLFILTKSTFNNLIQPNGSYILRYGNFNIPNQISTMSMIDFITDFKRALKSNDPSFSVRNEHIIDVVISSYQQKNLNQLNAQIDLSLKMIIGFVVLIIVLTIAIKAFQIKIKLAAREIFSIYKLLTPQQVDKIIDNFNELLLIGKNYCFYEQSSKNQKNKNSRLMSKSKASSELMSSLKNEEGNTQQKKVNEIPYFSKIKKQSNRKLIQNHLYIFLLPLVCAIYFFIFSQKIQTYQTNAAMVLQKSDNLQNSIILVSSQAQSFFQGSMEQILPPNQRTNWTSDPIQNLQIKFEQKLPAYFNEYIDKEKATLNYNLCSYSYLNTGSLYKNINCSQILNGAMDRGFAEAYILYLHLVLDYGGIPISKLGDRYRMGAKYPVFMEICYIRRTINNILVDLQTKLNKFIVNFVQYENTSLTSYLFYGIIICPFLLSNILFIIFQLMEKSKSVVKSFRILPKRFLLNIKITKYITKNKILQKILLFPF